MGDSNGNVLLRERDTQTSGPRRPPVTEGFIVSAEAGLGTDTLDTTCWSSPGNERHSAEDLSWARLSRGRWWVLSWAPVPALGVWGRHAGGEGRNPSQMGSSGGTWGRGFSCGTRFLLRGPSGPRPREAGVSGGDAVGLLLPFIPGQRQRAQVSCVGEAWMGVPRGDSTMGRLRLLRLPRAHDSSVR